MAEHAARPARILPGPGVRCRAGHDRAARVPAPRGWRSAAAALAAPAPRRRRLATNLPAQRSRVEPTLGAPILAVPYGVPSKYEANVQRRESPGLTRTPQSSVAFTPLQNLFGIITPSGLHFERHHAGCRDIDPHQHRLMVHGMVANPRIFTMDDLMRFPSVSRIHFIECGANTGMEWGNVAVPTVQYTHGMLSLQRMDRRAAVDAARRVRRRPQRRRSSSSPKAPTARR